MSWSSEGLNDGDVVWIGSVRTGLTPYKVTRVTKSAVFVRTHSGEKRYQLKTGRPVAYDAWSCYDNSIKRDSRELRREFHKAHALALLRVMAKKIIDAVSSVDNLDVAISNLCNPLQTIELFLMRDERMKTEQTETWNSEDSTINSVLSKREDEYNQLIKQNKEGGL